MLALLGAPLLASGAQAEDAAPLPSFLATLHVEGPLGRHDAVSVGVAETATDGYDVGVDAAKPPPPPGGAWVIASAGDERLARDVVGPAPTQAWTLRLDADGPAGALALRWDLQGFAALPPRTGVDMTIGNATVDVLDAPNATLEKPEGLWSATIALAVFPLEGDAPAAPRDLAAAPGARPGEVALSWAPPAEDGGHPLRRYVVYREGVEIARVAQPGYVDAGREIGERPSYHITAANRIGEGAPSAAVDGLGTGKPRALDAGDAQPGETALASQEHEQPAQRMETPAIHEDAASVHGEPYAPDPRRYAITFAVMGEEHELILAAPIPTSVDAALLDVPSQGADAPGAGASASLGTREGALVLRTRVVAGGERVDDGTAIPLAP